MAIENGVQNAELGYILDPAFQIENLNGKPVVGGYICIYEAGTDNKYISYENFDGAQNPFKIPLKADGRAVILGDPSLTYDVYAYDSYGNLLFSRLNVQCNVPGNISINGADTRIKNTDGTLDISLQTQANNVREYTVNTRNKLLDVQSPLYFVENSQSATIIGIKGSAAGYVTKDYVDSVVSGKLDTSAFSAVSGDFLTDKFEYDDNFNITGYDGSAFASNGETYSAGTNIDITDNVISVTGLPDIENAITSAVTNVENKFEYNENNYITAYNNSAFAGKEYSAGDYVSIVNDTISVTGLQPSGDYATKTDLSGKQDTLSAGDGISIVNNTISVTSQGGGIEQVSHDYTLSGDGNSTPLGIANAEDYVKQDDLTGYQPSGDYYSASNPSGFITSDDLTGYATTALVSSVSSELYSAVSSISGDFELVAGSGVELVDDPNAKTTTINVTAEGTPVTAIQSMIESATSGLQPSGDYYSASNPSGFISEVPNTYLQNTDLATFDGKVTAISGIPLSACGDVNTGTMKVTALEYDANNKITAYDGSAFAGGSEIPTAVSGYWQSASDTVCANSGVWGGSALPISAGPGIKLELVNDTLIIGTENDYIVTTEETVGDYSVANTDVNISGSFSKTGYKPIAWTWKYSFAASLNFNQETTNITDNTLNFQGYIRNIVGSDARSITFKLLITWVRI